MGGSSERLAAWLRQYGLAVCCIAAPLLLSLGVLSLTQEILIAPALHPGSGDARLVFSYKAAQPEAAAAAAQAAAKTAGSSPQQKVVPDKDMYLPALHYAGRASFAIASGFLYVASLTTLIFSAVILFRRWQWKGVISTFLIWSVVSAAITFLVSDPHGRYLVVRDLLNRADSFPGLEKFVFHRFGYSIPTGDLVEYVVHANTMIALVPVGMLLTALFAISIRAPEIESEDDLTARQDDLSARLMTLRCALVLGSACFVMGVLSNKALVEWPLQLVSAGQAVALRPIADSLILQFGALGTVALFAAFAPAIVAWMLDVERLKAAPAGADKPVTASPADGLVFAPMATVTAVIATLAPILASPVFDSLKALAGNLSK